MATTMKTDRKLNRLLSAAGMILVVLSMMLTCVLSAPAAETKGSLTLHCVFNVEGGARILANDEYSLAKIADASITDSSVTYTTLEQFKNYNCEWQNTAASKLNEKAKALAYYCKQTGSFSAVAVTDSNGVLKFDNLEIGLYLAVRTKTAPANEDIITDPLLVFIPENINGEIIYDLVSSPKFSYASPHNPDSSGMPSGGTLPQTGQLMWPITLLAVLGCFMILVGSALLRRGGSDEK